ncbi:MAG: class I SAM-dependent methyltransferase, partial [Pseudomonadota bacterium]
LSGRARADFDYCRKLAENAASVLDLGCGTGELAAILAPGRAITAIDPAAAMLEIARARPGGDQVTWLEADARSVRLGTHFDLVLLTGHAFQCFLTRAEQQAVLSTIAAHLEPNGRFIFDSRNPSFPGRKERNKEETVQTIQHPELGQIEAWNMSIYDKSTNILSYTNSYRVRSTGDLHSASAQIRYTTQKELAVLLERAGLGVDQWLGDWQGSHFSATAKEIIPAGRLR